MNKYSNVNPTKKREKQVLLFICLGKVNEGQQRSFREAKVFKLHKTSLKKCPGFGLMIYGNPISYTTLIQIKFLFLFLQRPYPPNAQYGFNWAPPAQSNETTNGYFLERSQTARMTLAKAFELCPDEVIIGHN